MKTLRRITRVKVCDNIYAELKIDAELFSLPKIPFSYFLSGTTRSSEIFFPHICASMAVLQQQNFI